nr:hypothetical protein [Tanacetum cinerariifolium]
MGDIPKPKKKKKAAAPTQSESSHTKDNEVSDNDEDLKYANQVSIEEFKKQEKERRTKHRRARIVLERQVNKEVDEGKESKKQSILEEIKRKDKGEGSEHDKSNNDSNRGDKSDKTSSDEESSEYDESDKDSDNGANQTRALMIKPTLSPSVTTSAKDVSRYLIEPPKIQMTEILNEPVHTEIDEQEARFGSTKPSQSKRTHDDPDNSEGEKKSKRRPKYAGESSSKKSKAQEVPPYFKTCNDADEPRQEDEPRPDNKQVHEAQKAQIDKILGKHNPVWFQSSAKEPLVQSWFNKLVNTKEEPKEYEYRDGSVTQFGKLMKKIFKKDVIRKDDVNGPLGKKRIPVRNFFNHDLEYLMNGTKENTYALFVTKTKAARYEDEGIEEMIPSVGSQSIQSTIEMLNWEFFTGTLDVGGSTKEILDFSPVMKFTPSSISEAFNVLKFLRNLRELYKFSDGTLNKVFSKLEIILRNNKVGYNNEGMEKYYWIKDDDKNTRKFVKKIEKALKERRRFRRLELFVGGRRDKTDYRLLIRLE